MNSPHKKNIFDSNGVLIKEYDVIKVQKRIKGDGSIYLIAKYDDKTQQWLFYSGTVPYTWEGLQLSNIKSITVITDAIGK